MAPTCERIQPAAQSHSIPAQTRSQIAEAQSWRPHPDLNRAEKNPPRFPLTGCMPQGLLSVMYDDYLPFRLYAEHKRGATPAQLAAAFAVSVPWVEERLEAIRLCLEKQIRIELAN